MAGIDIFDQQTGQLRDTYSILEDMAKVWPTLTKNQRQYLGEAAAGKRQINVLESLLQNWQGVERAVKAATNSTGSAEKENSKYLNSIEGKTKAVESAMQKLASATVDDSLIKWFLDVEKGALDFTTSIGGLTPIIAVLVTLLASKLAPALKVVGKTFADSIKGITGYNGGLQSAISIIGLLTAAVSIAISVHNNYIASLNEGLRASSETATRLTQEKESLSALIDSYEEMASSGNFSREEARQIQEKIVTLVGEEASSLDLVNGKLDEQKQKLDGISVAYAQSIKQDLDAAAQTAQNSLTGLVNDFWKKSIGGSSNLGTGLSATTKDVVMGYLNGMGQALGKYLSVYENSITGRYEINISDAKSPEDIKNMTSELKGLRQALIDAGLGSSDAFAEVDKTVNELSSNIDSYDTAVTAALSNDAFIEIKNQLKSFSVESAEDLESLIKRTVSATGASKEYAKAIREVATELLSEYSGKIKQASEYTSKYVSKTDDLKGSVANLTTEFENMDSAQSSLSKAVEEFNTDGSLSFETLKSLLSVGKDYLQYLTVENGKLVLNKLGLVALTEAKKQELLQDLKLAQASEISDAREQAKKQLFELHEMHLSAIETSERENEINSILDSSIVSVTDSYGNQIAMVSLLGTTSSDTTEELDKATEAYDKQSEALDDSQSAYDTLSSAIDEYNKNGVLSVDTLQSLLSLSPEYLQMFFDQAGALGDAEAATMAHVEALKQAKINELAAAAAAQILAVSQEAAGGAGSGATSGLSSFGSAAINMGNNAVASAGNVKVLQGAVYDLQQQLGTSVSVNWANAQVKGIVSNFNKLAGEIGGLGASFTSSGKKSSGGGSGSSKASQQAEAIADANEKLLDTTMKMIKAQKEDQIDALEDELDLEEELYEAEKKRLEDQIDKYKDVIDAKQKSLKLDKEQSEYDDEIADKNKEISDIQNRLTELEFDTSATAIAEKLKLQEDLTEKQKDLSESQADREYDLTNQALDDDYEAYKTSQEAQIELLNQNFEATKTDFEDRIQLLKDYLEEEGTIRTDALNMMGTKSAEFYNNLFAWNAKYGDVTNATLQSIIDKAYEVVAVSSGSSKSGTKKTTTVSKTVGTSVDWKALKTHHEGIDSGFVGSGLKGNEEFIKALKGEVYATPKQQDDYMEKYLPSMLKNAYVNGATNISAGTTMQYDKLLEINVSGSIDSDSVSKIQSTVNQAFGQLTSALAQRGTVRKANAFAI